MKNKYKKYTIAELLQDDYFISSVLHPSQESREFWEYLIQSGNISRDELEEAAFFVKSVQARKEKLHHKEKEALWNKIEIGNKKSLKEKVHTLYVISISVAACLILLLSISIYLYYNNKPEKNKFDTFALLKNKFSNSESDICLIISDNKHITFKDNNTDVKYNEKGEIKVNSQTITKDEKEKRLVSNEKKEVKNTVAPYNQLIVPKGKHSTLLLSDGTKLWINAGSHVIFPVTFEANKREIYVNGEVYLDVARNEACPFIVKTGRMEVKVLGTSFNVKSYENHEVDDIVLVTGSVHVETISGKKAALSPNQHFSCTSTGIAKVQTVDVYNYISWKDGLLQYKAEKLSVILQRLSDYYGKSIYWDPEMDELTCSGKLDLKDDMEKVLIGLTKIIPVKFTKQNESYYFSMNP